MTRTPSDKGTPCPVESTGPDQDKTRPDLRPLITAKRGDGVVWLGMSTVDEPDDHPLVDLLYRLADAVDQYATTLGLRLETSTIDTIGTDGRWPDRLGTGYDVVALNVVGGVPTVFRFAAPPVGTPPLGGISVGVITEQRAHDRLNKFIGDAVRRYAEQRAVEEQAGVRPLASLALVDGLAVLRVDQPARPTDASRDPLVDQFVDLLRPLAQQLGVRLAVGVADGQPALVDRGEWVQQAYREQLTGDHQPISRPGVYDVTKRIRVDDDGNTTMLDHPDGVPVAGFWPKTTTLVQPVVEPVELRTTLCLTPHRNDDVGSGKHGCVELMGHERRRYNGADLCRCACGVTWPHPSTAAGVDRG